jgi:hypothetical protein
MKDTIILTDFLNLDKSQFDYFISFHHGITILSIPVLFDLKERRKKIILGKNQPYKLHWKKKKK